MSMDWLFGKKKTPEELLRENKRMLDRAIRELDRERMGLQQQEKKLVTEIKQMAKAGQMDAVKVMAKSVVRNRHAVTKMHALKANLQGISLRIATLKSTQAMANAMRGATKAMRMMNQQLNLPNLTAVMRDFERQNEKMEMTSEMMGDAVDDAMEGEGEGDETDDLVNQVLDEIGINTMNEMVAAPNARMAAAPEPEQRTAVGLGAAAAGGGGAAAGGGGPSQGAEEGIDDDLQARLDKLRKG